MHIEVVGYILIPIGIFLYFLDVKYLVYTMIFFSSFTSSNIVTINDSSGIQPSYYFGALFLIKFLFQLLKRRKMLKVDKLLFCFVFLCLLSLFMPKILANSNIIIVNQKDIMAYQQFSNFNIIQISYLIFCFIIYIFLGNYFYSNPCEINKAIKVLCISCLVTIALGIYNEIAYVYNLPYDIIFRNGTHGNVQPFGNFLRVYSTANEPSEYAYWLAPMFGLVTCIKKQHYIHKNVLAIFIVILGVMSTSTTFFVGICAFIIKIVIDKIIIRKKNRKKRMSKIVPISIALIFLSVIIVSNLNANIHRILFVDTYNKLTGASYNFSGQDRSSSFLLQLKVGLEHPILGIGFGSARSKDLFSTWICNVGVIATFIFIAYLIRTIICLNRNKDELSYGISNFIFILFVCAFTAVPEPYYLYIWIVLAMAYVLIVQRKTINAT